MFVPFQDNPVGSSTGFYNNQKYFEAREGHGSFVPLCGLLKANDFDQNHVSASTKLPRRHKLVDEIELKRRSNSQQERLADYKMRQNLNRLKINSNSHSNSGGNSSNATDDNFSPSILGSLENEVDWTASSQSSPMRQNRFSRENNQRPNDLSLIGGPIPKDPPGSNGQRDPYASEDFLVSAQGMSSMKAVLGIVFFFFVLA